MKKLKFKGKSVKLYLKIQNILRLPRYEKSCHLRHKLAMTFLFDSSTSSPRALINSNIPCGLYHFSGDKRAYQLVHYSRPDNDTDDNI